MAGAVQIRLPTDLTGEDYVKRAAWRDASAPECPWHGAECELAPHGTYGRRTPAGARVRRFRCRQSGRTVSLLPDCLAARLPGTLAEVEAAARAAQQLPSLKEAADRVRPHGVGESAAVRWMRRRELLVKVCLELLRSLYPAQFEHVEPTLVAFGAALGTQAVLVRLRTVAAAQLGALPAPLGFRLPREKAVAPKKSSLQHKTGLSPPPESATVEDGGTPPPPTERRIHERTRC